MLTEQMRADGWIEHDGGPCPVPHYTRPRIYFRDGEPSGSGKVMACDWKWDMTGKLAIIAYRPETAHD